MKCDRCNEKEARIHITGVGSYCLDCNNEMMSDRLGMELFKDHSEQLTIVDEAKQYHVFDISNEVMPGYSKWVAEEKDGYYFEVMINTHEKQEIGFRQLQAKIFKAMSHRSLCEYDNQHMYSNVTRMDGQQYGLNSIGTGMVVTDSSGQLEDSYMIIDGKKISFRDFGKMAFTYNGFVMEYQFQDTSEEPISKNMALKKVDVSKDAVLFRFDRYQKWLLHDFALQPEVEKEYLQAMKECIDDLHLMLLAELRSECREVADHMISNLMIVECKSPNLIKRLIDDIERETWFLS